MKSIVDTIKKWQPKQLEKIIEDLFTKRGYTLLARNVYDGQGGDIDLVFTSFAENTLLEDIFTLSEVIMPDIRIQAKKKDGIDASDIDGALQLAASEGYEKAINILINTTEKFSDKTKDYANLKGIILISGYDFASLLVKYGLDVFSE